MGAVFDALALVWSAVHIFVTYHSGEFVQTVAIASVLAALCWLAAGNYSRLRSINIAVTEIKSDLQTQTDRTVPVARVILVMLFLLVQLVPFSLIGYAAYQDLKVTT